MASIGKDRSKVKKDEKREEEADVEKAKSGSSRTIFLKFQMSSQAAGTTQILRHRFSLEFFIFSENCLETSP